MQKEIVLETLTHIFYTDGTSVSKIEYKKKDQEIKEESSLFKIDVSGTDGSYYEIGKLIKSLNLPADSIVVF